MKEVGFLCFLLLGLVIATDSCNNSTEPEFSLDSLVSNPSFETNVSPSLAGWQISDSTFVRLVEDTPTGGGRWSLRIDASSFPGSYAFTEAPAVQGRHRYRFSLWCKNAGVTSGAAGLFFLPHDTTRGSLLNFLSVHDTVWTFYSFVDTMNSSSQDSMRILLIGGTNDGGAGQTFFDVCKLEKLD